MAKMVTYKKQFGYYKDIADKAIGRLDDAQLRSTQGAGSNSVAVIMKHVAGNMLSRWTDIFTTDGEKSWRDRDGEFVDTFTERKDLDLYWERAWERLFSTLDDLSDEDVDQMVYIRNMGCTVHDAIIRQLCHYSYHIGQIVYIAKALMGDDFESLSIAVGSSSGYNEKRFTRPSSIMHFTDDVE